MEKIYVNRNYSRSGLSVKCFVSFTLPLCLGLPTSTTPNARHLQRRSGGGGSSGMVQKHESVCMSFGLITVVYYWPGAVKI